MKKPSLKNRRRPASVLRGQRGVASIEYILLIGTFFIGMAAVMYLFHDAVILWFDSACFSITSMGI